MSRELLSEAVRIPVSLRQTLDQDPKQGVMLLQKVLEDLGRIEERVGEADPEQPVREVVRRYLARLRAAIEDLLTRRLRGDPGYEELLTGEVMPLSEGLEGLCRSLPAPASAEPPPAVEET